MRKIALPMLVLYLFLTPSSQALGSFQTVTIQGVPYISLQSLGGSRGLDYRWDPILKNAVLSSPRGAVKFHVGSEYILNRDTVVKLDSAVKFINGNILAPLSAGTYLEGISSSALPAHQIRKIVIDAGHGGQDHGAVSRWGVKEKELVLKVSRLIERELRANGIEAIMTRNSDVFIPLAERAKIANKNEADLFVSIHANASTTPSLSGFEIYYLSEAADDAALALERAENSSLEFETAKVAAPSTGLKAIVWDLKETENRKESITAANFVANAVEDSVRISHRRIKSAQFYVLKWAECPAILVETGYITNLQDQKMLRSGIYLKRLASSIVKGLLDYKEEFEKTDGFTR